MMIYNHPLILQLNFPSVFTRTLLSNLFNKLPTTTEAQEPVPQPSSTSTPFPSIDVYIVSIYDFNKVYISLLGKSLWFSIFSPKAFIFTSLMSSNIITWGPLLIGLKIYNSYYLYVYLLLIFSPYLG